MSSKRERSRAKEGGDAREAVSCSNKGHPVDVVRMTLVLLTRCRRRLVSVCSCAVSDGAAMSSAARTAILWARRS
eukprot:1714786-Rhodomonas_salina.1